MGDLMLDRYVWGQVERISAEAPVPVVHIRRTEDRLGGAGNAVKNLVSLGVNVDLSGVVGPDDEGKLVASLLDEDGVKREGLLVDPSRPTVIKTRVIAHSQQVVRIDREDTSPVAPEMTSRLMEVAERQIAENNIYLLSDYGKGTVTREFLAKLSELRQSKGGSIPIIVDPHPANHNYYSNITIAKPNKKEAEAASGIVIKDRASALEAGKVLIKRWNADMMLITLGEDGLMILPSLTTDAIFLETMAQEVFDVSGAGDTVTAVFSAAMAAGASLAAAGDLANIAAGIVVSEIGTSPIEYKRLRETIDLMSYVMNE